MALPDTTTIALAVVRGPNGGDTIATQTSQPGVGGMEYCVTLRKVDHRPCTCCDKPLLGPKDRIHSFCNQDCFTRYWRERRDLYISALVCTAPLGARQYRMATHVMETF